MRVGVQYYRVPNPERQYWRGDFERMAGGGISLARFWIYWSTVNPEPSTWQWDDLDELWSLAEEFGIGVVGQLIPESQPGWFVEHHEDLLPRHPDGTVAALLGHTIAAASRYPGITFEHREAQQGSADFMTHVVARFAEHAATHSWDVWNELQPFSISYDAVTTLSWQRWLASRFPAIHDLRDFAQVDVASHDALPLLRDDLPDQGSGTLNLRYLFREWKSDRMVDEMSRRADVVRAADAEHDVVSHRRGVTFLDPIIDEAKLAGVLDLWGTSNYGSAVMTPHQLADLGLKLSLARGVSGPKPFWLAETTAGRMYHLYGHTLPSGAEIRTSLTMALAHGAQSALLWQYRHERFGQEATGFGLLDFDGGSNDRLVAVEQVAAAIRERELLGGPLVREVSPVAVVYDPRTLWVERSMDQPIEQSVSVTDELLGWYTSLHSAGSAPAVLTPTAIGMHGLPAHLSVLVGVMGIVSDDTLGRTILDWVNMGGTYVETAFSGMLDERLIAPVHVPAGVLGQAQEGRVVARTYPLPPPDLTIDGQRIPGSFVNEVILTETDFDRNGQNVLVTEIGNGRIVHLGSLPGLAALSGASGLGSWVQSLIGAERRPVVRRDPGVVVERATRGEFDVVFGFNGGDSAGSLTINCGSGERCTVTDVFAGREETCNGEGLHEFVIEPANCVWLEMKGLRP